MPLHWQDTDVTNIVSRPFDIGITVDADGIAHVSSQLRQELVNERDYEFDVAGHAATDAIESLLLARAPAGVVLGTAAARAAVETAVENVANHLL